MTEVEITAEMVEAGQRELESWCRLFGHKNPDAVWLRATYRAMRALDPEFEKLHAIAAAHDEL